MTGIPADVFLTDVEWLGSDGVVAAGYSGDLFDRPGWVGIWRSEDGLAWEEVFRGEELWWQENGRPRIALARAGDRLVAVGTSCREGCRPIVLVSDGGVWRGVAVPLRPPAGEAHSPSGVSIRPATIDVPSRGAGIEDVIAVGQDLVAVGWAEVEGGGAHASAWRSTDGGVSWAQVPSDPPALGGPRVLHFERVFRLGDRLVAGGFEQSVGGGIGGAVWESEDGTTWRRRIAPGDWWLNGYAVVGRTMFAYGPDTPGNGIVLWASEDLEVWRVVAPSAPGQGGFVWRGLVASSDRALLGLGSVGESDPASNELSLWESTDGTSWVRVLEAAHLEWIIASASDHGWLVYLNREDNPTVRAAWISA